ncbi:MAG TPA: SIS domain-containing protein [Terriglobia bacterium]|nr:SIS domain-containing protein [Terriglobia bacterium]
MALDLHQQVLSGPRDLRETLEKGRREFEAMVRRVRWGEGPLFVVGTGPSYFAALTGVFAFEGLLGFPVIARRAVDFEAYAASVLRQRSLVLALSNSGETAATLDAARAARARGAVVLAMTQNPASTLAQTADLMVQLRAGETTETFLSTHLCQQAAVGYLALVAAQVLKRHHHHLDVLEDEFAQLPAQVERIQTHMQDAVHALAAELKDLTALSVVGGGFYHPIALQAARLLYGNSRLRAEGVEEGAFRTEAPAPGAAAPAVLFLSGAHCRVKKRMHATSAEAQKAGMKIYSVTDANDRELQETSNLSLLLPELTEMVGSTLTLALVQSLAEHACRHAKREPGVQPPSKARNHPEAI